MTDLTLEHLADELAASAEKIAARDREIVVLKKELANHQTELSIARTNHRDSSLSLVGTTAQSDAMRETIRTQGAEIDAFRLEVARLNHEINVMRAASAPKPSLEVKP